MSEVREGDFVCGRCKRSQGQEDIDRGKCWWCESTDLVDQRAKRAGSDEMLQAVPLGWLENSLVYYDSTTGKPTLGKVQSSMIPVTNVTIPLQTYNDLLDRLSELEATCRDLQEDVDWCEEKLEEIPKGAHPKPVFYNTNTTEKP